MSRIADRFEVPTDIGSISNLESGLDSGNFPHVEEDEVDLQLMFGKVKEATTSGIEKIILSSFQNEFVSGPEMEWESSSK